MEKIKGYLLANFEQLFVLFILFSTVVINYYISQKLAFLNFYFLPVILGAYYLGRRRAVLGAVFCAVMVPIYVIFDHDAFVVETSELNTYVYIVVWTSFLILAGALVGQLHDKLAGEVEITQTLNESLEASQAALAEANRSLVGNNQHLEDRVRERTFELEESKQAI